MASLGHVLMSVKSLKRLTYIGDTNVASHEMIGVTIVTSLEENQNNCQLDSLVLYGIDLSSFEAGRSLAWFLGR